MEAALCPMIETKQIGIAPADLRERQREFCEMWGCVRMHYSTPCFYCQIMRDVQLMRRELQATPESRNNGSMNGSYYTAIYPESIHRIFRKPCNRRMS